MIIQLDTSIFKKYRQLSKEYADIPKLQSDIEYYILKNKIHRDCYVKLESDIDIQLMFNDDNVTITDIRKAVVK